MTQSNVIPRLAAIAHELWCARMAREGWRFGPQFNPAERTHDALVPFEQLSPQDRRHACLGIEAEELERKLASAISYQRGPTREFIEEELWVGLQVGLVDPQSPDGRAPMTGSVEGWKTLPDDELEIRVKWSDGARSDYLACCRELVRLEQ